MPPDIEPDIPPVPADEVLEFVSPLVPPPIMRFMVSLMLPWQAASPAGALSCGQLNALSGFDNVNGSALKLI